MPAKSNYLVNGKVNKLELMKPITAITENSKSSKENVEESDIIKLNVSGIVYETLESTLERFPETLLGNSEKRERYYLSSRGQYFFDRNRTAFEAVLYYYQTGGILIRPPTIPMRLFAEDVRFFQLGDKAFMKLQKEEGYIQEDERQLPVNLIQRKIWELFEHPDTSLAARLLNIWSVLVIVVSISVFCLETLPRFKKSNQRASLDHQQPWFSFEIICITWFTIEYVVRFIASPCKWDFVKSFMNLIDIAAILPYYITLPMKGTNIAPLSVLRVIRLVRIFRIFKLSRHSVGLRILGHTLKESSRELGMLIFFLILGIVLFSSAIYFAEEDNRDFSSIPDTFWYSLVTMTTVGYGDKVPRTSIGKLLGSLCAIVGVLTIALPVPVIVSNFEFFYHRDRLIYDKTQATNHKMTTFEHSHEISTTILTEK